MVDSHPWLTTSRNKDPIFLQVSFDGFASHDGFGYPQQLESSGQNHSLAVDITMFFLCVCCMGNTEKNLDLGFHVRQMDEFLACLIFGQRSSFCRYLLLLWCRDCRFLSSKHKFEEGCVCHGQQYGALTCRSFKLFIYRFVWSIASSISLEFCLCVGQDDNHNGYVPCHYAIRQIYAGCFPYLVVSHESLPIGEIPNAQLPEHLLGFHKALLHIHIQL